MRLTTEESDQLLATGTVHRTTLQHDDVVFRRTSAQTGGQYSLSHPLAGPGSGVVRHYHRTYTERFDVLEGVLSVEVAGKTRVLQAGGRHRADEHPAPLGRPELLPGTVPPRGHPGATKASKKGLQMVYGLARDGKSTPHGVPRNLLHTAWLMETSDIW